MYISALNVGSSEKYSHLSVPSFNITQSLFITKSSMCGDIFRVRRFLRVYIQKVRNFYGLIAILGFGK